MEIVHWPHKRGQDAGYIVRVSRREAACLIESLSAQLVDRSQGRRDEFVTHNNEYFSIAIQPEPIADMAAELLRGCKEAKKILANPRPRDEVKQDVKGYLTSLIERAEPDGK